MLPCRISTYSQSEIKSVSNNHYCSSTSRITTPSQSENSGFLPKRQYYQPQDDADTYYINSEGHLQCHQDSQTIIKAPTPQELPGSKEHPIFHKPGSIKISSVEDLLRLYPNSFDRLGSLKGEYGLGACLLQDGQPIAYASKSLTDTETRYANIERELLAIVFACQRFNTYVLGRPFTVESDHKPLEMIHQKSLASAPPRLQRMLLQLQRYDVTIRYRPGKEMLLADALSRCPSRASGEIKLDMRVDYIAFSKTWIAKLKDTTREDSILGTVYQLTQQGWPHQRRHTPRMARVYWDFRDQLSTDEGLLLMGPRIVIPSCLREEYLQRLHQGHLSATKVQQNARQHLYWPGLDADIADYTKRCQECIRRSQPPKEPLQAHEVPQEPWERIAMDYFYMNGRLYILICDYFSKFPFLFQVKTTSFANLKDHLEELFSVEGIPDEIMSDNGPPFNGKEFSSYLTGLGIRHTTSSPNYP